MESICNSIYDSLKYMTFSTLYSQVFQRILKAYATKLFARLPKGGTGIVAAATGMDGQIKVSVIILVI